MYALIFLPFLPVAIVAIAAYGIGLAAFIPLGAFLIALSLARALIRRTGCGWRRVRHGALLLVPVFFLASSPEIAVSAGLRLAQSPDHYGSSLWFLKRFANSFDIGRAGCSATPSVGDVWTVPLQLWGTVSEREVRAIYPMVTGESFEDGARRLGGRCIDSTGVLRPPRN
jgi:hypothetical protein